MEDYLNAKEPLPGWQLHINEISNGCYEVSLTDWHQRRVEIACFDQEIAAAVQSCVAWVKNIENEAGIEK